MKIWNLKLSLLENLLPRFLLHEKTQLHACLWPSILTWCHGSYVSVSKQWELFLDWAISLFSYANNFNHYGTPNYTGTVKNHPFEGTCLESYCLSSHNLISFIKDNLPVLFYGWGHYNTMIGWEQDNLLLICNLHCSANIQHVWVCHFLSHEITV